MNRFNLRISLCFILGLIATIIPLPTMLLPARPVWVLCLLLYLQFYRTEACHWWLLLLLGLVLDVLLASTLGEHVLALTLVIWVASNQVRRFTFFSIGHQMLFIGSFCLFYQLILVTIDAFLGLHQSVVTVFVSSAVSVLFWPWLRLMAEEFLTIH